MVSLLLNRDGTVRKQRDSEKPIERGNFVVIKRGRDISVEAFCDECVKRPDVRMTSDMKRLPAQSREQAHERAEALREKFGFSEKSRGQTPRLAKKPSEKGMTAPILKKPLKKALEKEVGVSA